MDVCRARVPERTSVGDTADHWVACWLFSGAEEGVEP
jgi:hypothetical protein